MITDGPTSMKPTKHPIARTTINGVLTRPPTNDVETFNTMFVTPDTLLGILLFTSTMHHINDGNAVNHNLVRTFLLEPRRIMLMPRHPPPRFKHFVAKYYWIWERVRLLSSHIFGDILSDDRFGGLFHRAKADDGMLTLPLINFREGV